MSYLRKNFYVLMAGLFPLFFLLHWNGLLSVTYWWAVEMVAGTRSFLPQVSFAFLSSLVIFAVIILLFEVVLRFLGNPDPD